MRGLRADAVLNTFPYVFCSRNIGLGGIIFTSIAAGLRNALFNPLSREQKESDAFTSARAAKRT